VLSILGAIVRRAFLSCLVVLLAASATTLWAFRTGVVATRPGLLAGLVAALGCGLVAELAYLGARAWRGVLRPWTAAGRAILLVGLLTVLAGGMLNWLLSLQGYVVLVEGESARLGAGGQLEGLESGPLGDPRELEIDLALVEVDLQPAGGGTFDAVSLLETRRGGGAVERQEVGGGKVAEVRPLLLRQGTFGYAPRVVLLRGERTAFDRVVPFTTRREGVEGTSFSAEIHLEREGLDLVGEIALDTLDERLRGHPGLRLAARKGEVPLGEGELLLGQFAELADGYRVGFAGLKKWSEIDVARRNYPMPMVLGLATAALGALLWLVAGWRGR